MKKTFTIFLYFAVFTYFVNAQENCDTTLLNGFHSISSLEIQSFAETLCQPKWKGRRAGSLEYMEAAQFVADSFASWGLKPIAPNDSWFQTFPHERIEVESSGTLSIAFPINNDTLIKHYTFPDDYFPGSSSASGQITAPLVWVGFGISAPELNYDDYKNVDVEGKIVVIEMELPVNSTHKDYAQWSEHSSTASKVKNAISHGAIGLIFIAKLANPSIPYHDNFVYCYMKEEATNDLFLGTSKKRKELLQEIKSKLSPQSFDLCKTATISAKTTYSPDGTCCNVLGLLEGSDPKLKDEVIILGAHLDGVGNTGAFFPCALDNASGCVDLMAIAQALSKSKVTLKRSILFIMFGAEETGLRGSDYYVSNPLIAKNQVVCMFNFDMVGNGRDLGVWGGDSYPEINRHFKEANDKYIHRKFHSSKYHDAGGRARTDGMVFGRAGYKSMAAITPNAVKKVFYHHDLGDTPSTLVPEIMEDISKLFYLGLIGLANDTTIKLK
ncbi:MAG: M28 family peptidase [Ignavibacteria bacterium]|jgi:hypothetical protein|nr:M28 family peptidase [Ignavibacteria bacterium]